jgi:DNA-binding transcriptional ArsR family regulator
MMPPPIPDELVELIARRFRLVSEPMRIRLLDRLRDGEATVHQLADELGTSEQNISKHLTLSADAGVLARRKEGNRVYYRIVDPDALVLCERVCGSVEQYLLELAALVHEPAAPQPESSFRWVRT